MTTTLHELAHMWFGDLVTMKWFNDLWLNESFATYMSFLALTEAPELVRFRAQAWLYFQETKFRGVSTDQLATTHPICSEISSLEQAKSVFDGVTYGKGASFLKQLHFVIGSPQLKAALHRYFDKYAWENTVLDDFVGVLQEAYDQSEHKKMGDDFKVKEWSNTWLKTRGVNTLEGVVQYDKDSKIQSFAVKQTVDKLSLNRLRQQVINVAFYDHDFNPTYVKDVVLSGDQELNQITVNLQKPVAAYLINYGDHTYAKVRYDSKSVAAFKANLHRIKDPLARNEIWNQLWYHITDEKITSLEFIDFVVAQLPSETSEISLRAVMLNVKAALSAYVPVNMVA